MIPRDTGVAERPAAAALSSFAPAGVMAQQQRIAEAMVACGQKFLEGLQEITRRSALLQAAFLQQALTGWASVTATTGGGEPADAAMKQASNAAEATVASLRDVMDAACKCHTEALATFQQHVADTDTGACGPQSEA